MFDSRRLPLLPGHMARSHASACPCPPCPRGVDRRPAREETRKRTEELQLLRHERRNLKEEVTRVQQEARPVRDVACARVSFGRGRGAR